MNEIFYFCIGMVVGYGVEFAYRMSSAMVHRLRLKAKMRSVNDTVDVMNLRSIQGFTSKDGSMIYLYHRDNLITFEVHGGSTYLTTQPDGKAKVLEVKKWKTRKTKS